MPSTMGLILRLELPERPEAPLRVRVRRDEDDLDYGWVRLDELSHLITAMATPVEDGDEPAG